MALFKTGSLLLKNYHPTTVNPLFVIPSTLNIQSRNAARKGYREKARQKLKQKLKESVIDKTQIKGMKQKTVEYVKTVELSKPDVPDDDIIIMNNFKHMKFSLSEAIKLHREFHHPTVFNNPEAYVYIDIEIDMTGKKLTQVLKPFHGIVAIPHPFVYKCKKEILVFCEEEHKQLAIECGASIAGGQDLIKKLQGGVIQEALYDYILCHVNFLQELTPIRGLLKNKLPKAKQGTLTADLKSAIYKFLHGIEYTCIKPVVTSNFGYVTIPIGTINMDLEHLEANLKSVIADVMNRKPAKDRQFVTWMWCRSPPSMEKFAIDLSLYLEKVEEAEVDDDDDEEEEISPEGEEKKKIKELKKQAAEL